MSTGRYSIKAILRYDVPPPNFGDIEGRTTFTLMRNLVGVVTVPLPQGPVALVVTIGQVQITADINLTAGDIMSLSVTIGGSGLSANLDILPSSTWSIQRIQ
jgi:hypothetical protein